jgi:glucosamine-phosphate N-acetyltransferase
MELFFDKLQNIILNNNISKIEKIKNKYIELLSNLTTTENLNNEDFLEIINKIHKIGAIYVCYYYENDEIEIIASGTIIIEPKIIHSGKNVGHIEDIVVHSKHQGKGLSTKIVKYLKDYGLENNCYKIILDCDKNIKKVYEKNDFYEKDIQMVYYK